MTDCQQVYICRRNKRQLLKDKEEFNKGLQVQEEELLNLLQTKLGMHDNKATYTIQPDGKNIKWVTKLPLGIYNFRWEFTLELQPKFNIAKLIMNEIIQPLGCVLAAQEDRCSVLEGRLPASQRVDKVDDWKALIKNNRGRSLNDMGISTKTMLKNYAFEIKDQEIEKKTQKIEQSSSRSKTQILPPRPQLPKPKQSQLKTQPEKKPQKQKTKKRKIDFL